MSPSTLQQTIGNLCAGIALIIVLLPMQHLLAEYARQEVSDDRWVTPALLVVLPLWLMLMGALLCVTASGGFDWLRLGRTALYPLTVAAAMALTAVTFVFVALYIRPGFTPRALYSPVIHLVPLATVLLVLLSLNQRLVPGMPLQWLHRPWTLFAALSLVVCVGVFGYWMVRTGVNGVAGIVHGIRNPGPSSTELLAQIATLDPEKNFDDLLGRANRDERREVREAATARLRLHPRFLEHLSNELETGYVEPALAFLRDAALSPAEESRLARPARKAMQRWVDRIPAPNYTTKAHLWVLKRWGTEMFRVLPEKFASTGVDFTPVLDDFKDKVEPTR